MQFWVVLLQPNFPMNHCKFHVAHSSIYMQENYRIHKKQKISNVQIKYDLELKYN